MSFSKVTVRVPGTTANVGPGFDSFGCALGIYNTVSVAAEGEQLVIDGCDKKYAGPDNLVYQSYTAAMQRFGLPTEKSLHITIGGDIPVSRGLGSSAALLAAGAAAAAELHPEAAKQAADAAGISLNGLLLQICNPIEGHPDNLAPALFGGMTVSMVEQGVPYTVACPVHPSLNFVAVIPDFELSTHLAREVLPQSYSRADAVYNLSHGAVLLKALEQGNTALIGAALRDRLHQPYREQLIAHYDKAKQAALALGAISYCISGAGPTQLALVQGDGVQFAQRLNTAILGFTPGWQVQYLPIDTVGTCAVCVE